MDRFSQSLATVAVGVCLSVHEQMLIGKHSIAEMGILKVQHLIESEVGIVVAVLCDRARVLRLAHPGRQQGTLPSPRVGPNLSGQKFSDHKCRRRKITNNTPWQSWIEIQSNARQTCS